VTEEDRRVLVVDDDPDLAQLVARVLERRAGSVVDVALDAATALELLDEHLPDVVVTDIEMRGTSGLEMLRTIRERAPWMPVVVMTAHVSVDYAVSALREQADEFLTKPLDNAHLVQTVVRLAQEGRARRAHRAPPDRPRRRRAPRRRRDRGRRHPRRAQRGGRQHHRPHAVARSTRR